MDFKEKINKNYARIGTFVFHALLLLYFAFYGLTYQDPPPEEGIAINFGYEKDGAGNTSQATPVTTPPPTPSEPIETPQSQEEVMTQEIEEAPVINDPAEVTSTSTPTEPVQNPKETVKEPTTPEPDPVPELTPEEIERQKKQEELNRRFNTQNKGQGEGQTQGGGDQGDPTGDPLSPNRDGSKGSGANGSGDDYKLRGRTAVNKPIPRSDCNATGVVVVSVNVDANGKVTKATGGVNIPNGPKSNYVDPCLKRVAESAAKKTTWSAKNGANIETGYIVYRFELQ